MKENNETSNNEDENTQSTETEKITSEGKNEEIIDDESEPIKKELSKSSFLNSQNEVKDPTDKDQQETVVNEENSKDSEVNEQTEQKETAADKIEEIKYQEEPPPDPAAPYNLSDSTEAMKQPFELRPDQLAELEELWDLYQDYTPAYTDINGYITEKELVYMLKSLFLMPYTHEQLQELIAFCVRPPHPEGHIEFNQFVKIATIRYRDISIEDNLRSALQVLDQGEGLMNREHMKEVLTTMGHTMPVKQVNLLIKEVDIRNDGLIGIEDVMATICIDLIFE